MSFTSAPTPAKRYLVHLVANLFTIIQMGCPLLLARAVHAQPQPAHPIVADKRIPGQKPVVNVTANGIPLVQIAPPSAAGVSNNRFTHYNVGPQGVILNNSGVNSATQLSGWVSGNPMLGNQRAAVIVNQVTSANSTVLQGYTEVAGNPAQVIVANPNGIMCDGCGFIHTPRVTLTTGVPVFTPNGSLTGLDVRRGQIGMEGLGLNASNVERLDLYARSIRINAQLWANYLNAIAGANLIDPANNHAMPQAGLSSGEPPFFALDVKELGSMYANAFRMIGTEKGVGVNMEGAMYVTGGAFELNSAGDLTNTGAIRSQGSASIAAAGLLRSTGTITSDNHIQLQAGALDNTGAIAAGVDADGQPTRAADLKIATDGILRNQGQLFANTIALNGSTLHLDQGQLDAPTRATLIATDAVSHRYATLRTGTLLLNPGNAFDNSHGAIWQSGVDDFTLYSPVLTNTGGTIHSNARNFSIVAQRFDNQQGIIGHAGIGLFAAQATERIDNSQGDLATNGSAHIASANVINTDGYIQTQSALTIDAPQTLDNSNGNLLANGSLTATTRNAFSNLNGHAVSAHTLSIAADAGVDNRKGVLQGNIVRLATPTLDNSYGTLAQLHSTDQAIDLTGALLNTGGLIASNAVNFTLRANNVNNGQGSILHTGTGLLTIAADGAISNHQGQIATNGQGHLAAQTIANVDGVMQARQGLGMIAQGDINNHKGALVSGGGGLALRAGHRVINTQGLISSGGNDGDLVVDAAYVHNQEGALFAQKDLLLAVQGYVDNSQGTLQAEGRLHADIVGAFSNDQGIVQADRIDMQADSVSNVQGNIVQLGKGDTLLTVRGDWNNTEGKVHSNGDNVQIDAANLNNTRGTVTALNDLQLIVKGNVDNNQGRLFSDQRLRASIGGVFDNHQGQVQGQRIDLRTAQLTDLRRAKGAKGH